MSDPVQLLPESLVPVHGPDVHWSRNLFHLFHFLWDVTCVLRIAVKLSVDGTITRLPVGREHLVKKVSCCSWSRRRTKLWFSWWCCLWFWRLGRLLWLDQSKCLNNNYIWPSQLGYKGGNIKVSLLSQFMPDDKYVFRCRKKIFHTYLIKSMFFHTLYLLVIKGWINVFNKIV